MDPLEIAGRRLVIGRLDPAALPQMAIDALARGRDSPSLLLLAEQHPADGQASADLLRRALEELGIDLPAPDEAAWSLALVTARSIVDGAISPAAGANEIWASAYHRVRDSGDLRIFVGLASMLDDHPEDRAAIEAQIVTEARELLRRPRARPWIKLVARAGRSPLSRTAGDGQAEVHPADLPIGPDLAAGIEEWAADRPLEAGPATEAFARRGADLAARLQSELGPGYRVEYLPEPGGSRKSAIPYQ